MVELLGETVNKYIYQQFVIVIYITSLYIISSLPNYIFRDRDSYIYYAANSQELIDFYSSTGLLNLLVNEPLFLLINKFLSSFLDPYFIPVFYTLTTFSIFFWLLSKQSRNVITLCLGLILFFIITYTFHLQFVTLRQSLASFMLLLGLYYFKDNKKIILLCFLAGFIHSSFYFIFVLLILNWFLKTIIKKAILRYIIQFAIIFLLGFIAIKIASYLGMRQAENLLDSNINVGGGAWIIWTIITIYIILWGNKTHTMLYEYSLIGLTTFIALYFTTPFVGRLITSFIPAVILVIVSRFRFIEIIIILFLLLPYGYLVFNGVLNDLSFTGLTS